MGRGRLRASDADREQVIDTLKSAFVQGWLTRDQLGLCGAGGSHRRHPCQADRRLGATLARCATRPEAGGQEGGCVGGVREHSSSAGSRFPYLLRWILRLVLARLYRVYGGI